MCQGPGAEGEAQELLAVGRMPLVAAHERFHLHLPAGFLQGLAHGGLDQAFARVQVTGGLVQHPPSVDALLHQQQPARARDHAGHGDGRMPVAAGLGRAGGGGGSGHGAGMREDMPLSGSRRDRVHARASAASASAAAARPV